MDCVTDRQTDRQSSRRVAQWMADLMNGCIGHCVRWRHFAHISASAASAAAATASLSSLLSRQDKLLLEMNTRWRCHGRCSLPPVSHYRIAPPEKSPPADNLLAKLRPARRAGGRTGRFFTGKLSAGKRFFWEGDHIMGRHFISRRYFDNGRHNKSVIISPWADFL